MGLNARYEGGELIFHDGAGTDLLKLSPDGSVDVLVGDKLKLAGVAVVPDAAEFNLLLKGVAAGYKLARGQHTTVAAVDTVATGLATVVAAIAVLDDDPTDDPFMVSCSIGDQAGSPAAGSILIKSWKNTGGTDPTPLAAGTFTKKVNWVALGT